MQGFEDSDGSGREAALSALLDGFEPVAPDPSVWKSIESTINGQTGAGDRNHVGKTTQSRTAGRLWRLTALAAAILSVVGIAAVYLSATAGSGVVAQRSLADPGTGETVAVISVDDAGVSTIDPIGLADLDEGLTYQLWAVTGEEIVSVGLLGSEPGDSTFRIEGSPSVLALTIEVAGGVAVSEAVPVAVWQA